MTAYECDEHKRVQVYSPSLIITSFLPEFLSTTTGLGDHCNRSFILPERGSTLHWSMLVRQLALGRSCLGWLDCSTLGDGLKLSFTMPNV